MRLSAGTALDVKRDGLTVGQERFVEEHGGQNSMPETDCWNRFAGTIEETGMLPRFSRMVWRLDRVCRCMLLLIAMGDLVNGVPVCARHASHDMAGRGPSGRPAFSYYEGRHGWFDWFLPTYTVRHEHPPRPPIGFWSSMLSLIQFSVSKLPQSVH